MFCAQFGLATSATAWDGHSPDFRDGCCIQLKNSPGCGTHPFVGILQVGKAPCCSGLQYWTIVVLECGEKIFWCSFFADGHSHALLFTGAPTGL